MPHTSAGGCAAIWLVACGMRRVACADERELANEAYKHGRLHYERAEFDLALPFFEATAKHAPHFPEPYVAMGQLLSRVGRVAEAQTRMAEAHTRLAAVEASTSEHAAKRPLSELAAAAAEALPEQHARIGQSLRRLPDLMAESGRLIEQMANSSHAEDRHNARIHKNQMIESEQLLRKVCEAPRDAQAWWAFALSAFNTRREYASASIALGQVQVLSQAPLARMSYTLLFHSWQHACDWRDWESRFGALKARLVASLAPHIKLLDHAGDADPAVLALESPYILLVTRLVDMEPELVRRGFARQAALQQKQLEASAPSSGGALHALPASSYIQQGKLTVGYLSGLPAGHVTYDLVGSMLRFHIDKCLNVLWYTSSSESEKIRHGSADSGGMKEHTSQLRTLRGPAGALSAQDAARRIASDRVGLLIDLDGWIGDETPRQLVAMRPAPVRSQWLGWAGTTGDPSVHLIVADRVITHPRHRRYYSERLLILPGCYQLNDHLQLYARIAAGAGAGALAASWMPTERLIIANLNQLMKISPDIFDLWASAMKRVPGAQLLLLTGVTSARVPYLSPSRNLQAELAVRGLHASRLLRGDALRKHAHLARAAQCDMAVDTLSYNSHTTGSDALWAGLPLVTQAGRYLASRVGSSLTLHVGVPEVHMPSLKAYEDAIFHLARSSQQDLDSRGLSVWDWVHRRQHPRPELGATFGTFQLGGDLLTALA